MTLRTVAKFLLTIKGRSPGARLEMIARVEGVILQLSTLKMRTMQPLHLLAIQQKKLTLVCTRHLVTPASNGQTEALSTMQIGDRESPTIMAMIEELRTAQDSFLTIKHGMIFTVMALLGMAPAWGMCVKVKTILELFISFPTS